METMFVNGVGWAAGIILGLGVFGWLFPVACFLLIFPLEENEKGGWAFVTLALLFAFIYALTNFNVLLEIRDHWATAVAVFLGWFMIGALWSVFKWNMFVKEYSEKAKQKLTDFIEGWATTLRQFDSDPSNSGRYGTFVEFGWAYEADRRRQGSGSQRSEATVTREETDAARRSAMVDLEKGQVPDKLLSKWNEIEYSRKPTALQYKSMITTWITFWPWSMIAYAFTDLLRHLIDAIIAQLSGIYNAITNRHYADMDSKYFK